MSNLPIDNEKLTKPLEGMDILCRLRSLAELKSLLREALLVRALICLSPNRGVRCDNPATGVFWQDASEWYPCCDEHWPSGSQWLGHTRFYGYNTHIRVFSERADDIDFSRIGFVIDGMPASVIVRRDVYNRENAT